jgi:Rrf2 family protein
METMMSTTAQYALRALSQLSRQADGQPVLGRELARGTNIPANYLSKLMWQLRKAGLVSATRGAKGGYRLERPAGQVRLIEVIEVFDRVRAQPPCLTGRGEACCDRRPCAIHQAWKKVRDVYLDFLEGTTLADLSAADDSPKRPPIQIARSEGSHL